jgi:signal transduction histidine kinase/CheY-like chemotaxis protein
VFSQQEKKVSKKQIEKKLTEAGYALVNLEVEKSLKLSKESLNEAHALKDNVLIAKAYNIIGLNFEEFNDVSKGIAYYKKALYFANLTQNDSIKCWINNNLGNAYSYREIDKEKGIEYYNKGLQYSIKIKDSIEIMYSKLSLTGAYFAVNQFDKGIKYLESCKDFINKSNELEAKITLNTQYGLYYSEKNQNDKAEFHFNEAVNLGKQNKDGLIDSHISEVYKDFSNYYRKNKNFEKALYYFNLYDQLHQNVYNEERLKNAKLSGNQFELEEYQKQIDKIESINLEQFQTLKKSKVIMVLSLIICLILSLLTYTFYKNFKFRDKVNKELTIANDELKIAKEQAEESTKLKTQFVSTISHELRTPLYGVVGITNLITEEHKELENSPHLNSLKFSARYLLSLVNDLLQINKIEEKRITLEKMVFNVSDELKTIADSLEFISIKNNNKIILEIDTDIPEFVIGDKLRLSQIFINLVSNALKFTRDGEVQIIANLEKTIETIHFINFKVKDNGIGIELHDQEKIFEKFVQLERKEGDYQGTGLGLSIVKKLVEIFGGKVQLESEFGKGTTFSFTIGFDTDLHKRNEIINNIEVDLSTNNVYKVLVVEDNKINQIVTKKTLENNNYKCTVVEDGYAAINLLETEKYDIILMDINMPIINGFETTKLIRKKGIRTPIVALTAFDKQEVTEQAISCGMNDIIVKPFETGKLFQIISSLINE